ncbi:MAG: TonB-dependent receptor [Crocinitomicaceae bacterium]|nr:TonB-dependent receptor [Crocinitomicaceae bacterium]
MITSANRLAERPDDLSQEIIIVEGSEIRKFGYSTLVDVLKSIPGFRTSQPGNAIEGETFLMRGLVGNDHAKILINGIPIKPEAVKGMPIASQLPVRHAERIEIVLGPASASYGSDAMAGVINIVLPEVDRPVFAWADVNILTPKTSDFNLTLGGKVGKGKNILNYEIFASSFRADDVNLLIPDDSIKLKPGEFTAQQMELFVGEDSIPAINELKRESRLLGAYVKFRWFEFNAMNMFREEHSAFGYHPVSRSYHKTSTTYGENINTFSLKYKDEKKKRFQSRAAISALAYRTITNSSFFSFADILSSGDNFIYAKSIDLHVEYQGDMNINQDMSISIGFSSDFSASHPFTNYLYRPYRKTGYSFELDSSEMILSTAVINNVDSTNILDVETVLEPYYTYNTAVFANYVYRSKSNKFNLNLGARLDYDNKNELIFTPKIGLVYRPFKKIRFRANYGKGHRQGRSYNIFNNYSILKQEFDQGIGLKRSQTDILTEQLHGLEFGLDWKLAGQLKLKLGYYAHYITNKVMHEYYDFDNIEGFELDKRVGYGFFNGLAYSFLQAANIEIHFKQSMGKIGLDILGSYEFAEGTELVFPESLELSEVTQAGYRFVPKHSGLLNLNIDFSGFTLSFRNKIFGSYVADIVRYNEEVYSYTNHGVTYNLDILLHKDLFRQLSVFGGTYNVLGSVQSGIPNINLTDVWKFNPQYGTVYRIGLNFKLN